MSFYLKNVLRAISKAFLQKSNLLSEIQLSAGYIWLFTFNHAKCVSNYNSLLFTASKFDIKSLEEKKNLSLTKVTSQSSKKKKKRL